MRGPTSPEFEIGQLAKELAVGFYAHHAAMQIARHPAAAALAPPREPGDLVSLGRVAPDADYHFTWFLEMAAQPEREAEFNRVWFAGALLTLGDALDRHNYFDRAPILEMTRHMRNAVAHGNRFEIRNPGQLLKYPAHTRGGWSSGERAWEITPALHGCPFMFDFMEPGSIIEVLLSTGSYLQRVADGQPGYAQTP